MSKKPLERIGETTTMYFPEDFVCSLQLANKLKKLGVNQRSLFCYDLVQGLNFSWQNGEYNDPYFHTAAFTVSELGQMLPKSFKTWQKGGYWIFNVKQECVGFKEKEVNARAKMLIYLLENNLLNI